jgi:hypothetical protein
MKGPLRFPWNIKGGAIVCKALDHHLAQLITVLQPIATLGGHLPQRDHHRPDVNLIGAVRAAHLAPQAQPDIAAGQDLLALTQLKQAQNAIRAILHGESSRAARRALVALVTKLDDLTAQLIHLLSERNFGHSIIP